MHKCTLYKKLKNKEVECRACSWYCRIPEGSTGICGVRQNRGGNLYLLVYGKAIASNIDNIEKKPLYHFMPGTEIFSIGTFGCNFKCTFCQNWDISQATKGVAPDKLKKIISEGADLPPKKIVDYCLMNGIPSVAYTYNEPAVFFEYAYDTAKLAHENGLKNVYVSNGFESKEALEKLKPYLDAINIDLKGFTDEFYVKICGAKIDPVKENIKRVHKMGIWLEVTTLVIPGKNDSDEELGEIAKFIKSISDEIPWHVTAFYPTYKMTDVEPTPLETLERAYKIGKKVGLKYVYTGNIPGTETEHTYCVGCGEELINRYGLTCNECKIGEDGKCPKCGEKIPGVFK